MGQRKCGKNGTKAILYSTNGLTGREEVEGIVSFLEYPVTCTLA